MYRNCGKLIILFCRDPASNTNAFFSPANLLHMVREEIKRRSPCRGYTVMNKLIRRIQTLFRSALKKSDSSAAHSSSLQPGVIRGFQL